MLKKFTGDFMSRCEKGKKNLTQLLQKKRFTVTQRIGQ